LVWRYVAVTSETRELRLEASVTGLPEAWTEDGRVESLSTSQDAESNGLERV
jgi:hypothetical protein